LRQVGAIDLNRLRAFRFPLYPRSPTAVTLRTISLETAEVSALGRNAEDFRELGSAIS